MAHIVLVVVVPYVLGDVEPHDGVHTRDTEHTDVSSNLTPYSSP